MIAVLEAFKAGAYRRDLIGRNVLAGIVVGIVALPLSMAFAIASGVRPEQGIYTAIIGGLCVTLFGGSRVQIAGPTGAFIVILAGISHKYGVAGLQIATLMAGIMLVVMGLARVGGVLKFIPAPVIVGFTAGIAVIIFVGQLKDFFGLEAIAGAHFHEKFVNVLAAMPTMHTGTVLIGMFGLLILLIAPRTPFVRRVPAPLSAMLLSTLVLVAFDVPGVATIGSAFGGVPQGLPGFVWPALSMAQVVQLIGPAFTIAMLGAIESLLSAVVADGMLGTRHDSNQELIGQGIANIATPFFGGFAATGAIARTATSVRNGGSNPLAGIVHTLTLVTTVLLLAPLAAHIPLAALSAILFVVAYNMSEAKHFVGLLKRAPRADKVILLVTFLLTIFVDLVVAVNIGVMLAVIQFMRRMAESVQIKGLESQDLASELAAHGISTLPLGVLVFEIEGPMFFAAVDNLERVLMATHSDPKVLILRLRRVPFVDFTALEAISSVIAQLQKRGMRVILCEANEKVHGKLMKAGVFKLLAAADYSASFRASLSSLLIANGAK